MDKYLVLDTSFLREGDPRKIIANPSKIKEELNWSTKVEFQDLVKICINSRVVNL